MLLYIYTGAIKPYVLINPSLLIDSSWSDNNCDAVKMLNLFIKIVYKIKFCHPIFQLKKFDGIFSQLFAHIHLGKTASIKYSFDPLYP